MNDKVKSLLTIQISIILKDDNEIHFGFGPLPLYFVCFPGFLLFGTKVILSQTWLRQ